MKTYTVAYIFNESSKLLLYDQGLGNEAFECCDTTKNLRKFGRVCYSLCGNVNVTCLSAKGWKKSWCSILAKVSFLGKGKKCHFDFCFTVGAHIYLFSTTLVVVKFPPGETKIFFFAKDNSQGGVKKAIKKRNSVF